MLPRVATDLNLLLFRRGKFLRRMMIIVKKRRNMVDKLFSLLGIGADNGHVKLRNPAIGWDGMLGTYQIWSCYCYHAACGPRRAFNSGESDISRGNKYKALISVGFIVFASLSR
jgi:hypothetical protein